MSALSHRFVVAVAAGVHRPRRGRMTDPTRHAITRQEARWFAIQASHRQCFGNPEAARVATLAVFDIDLREHREEADRG